MVEKIIKRDGSLDIFDVMKIANAIRKAFEAYDKENVNDDEIERLAEKTLNRVDEVYAGTDRTPTVEHVQDIVENTLMKEGYLEVAKLYIVYRNERAQKRKEEHDKLVKQFENKKLYVIKRNGKKEKFDIGKLERTFNVVSRGMRRECKFSDFIEAFKKNIVPDMKTEDINKLSVKTAIDLVSTTNIKWQHIAARFYLGGLYTQAMRNRKISFKEVYSPESYKNLFDSYIKEGLYYKDFYKYYSENDILEAGKHLSMKTDDEYEYTTVLSFGNRYLNNPNGVVRELPQEMYMSVALFLAIPEPEKKRLNYAIELYKYISGQYISLPTPTLLNARTNYHQLSSCFKLNVEDDLRAIYHSVENIAQISKFGGGVGVYLGNIRPRGASIRGVKGVAGGVNPWIKVINATAVAVNQLGARAGAVSVTLDMWHLDIFDFLDLQTETGDIRNKAFDIFPAVSIPDIFMRRVKADEKWTIFDPHEIEKVYGKRLQDYFGKDFDEFYERLEKSKKLENKRVVRAKELFVKYLKVVVETGMPYVFFRDLVNKKNPNSHVGNIYSTQLCTEICQNTSPSKFIEEKFEDGTIEISYEVGDTVVCNLASINVAKVNTNDVMKKVFPVMERALDNVISLNYYPIEEARQTALKYRSIGIGYLGLAEYLAVNHLHYDSEKARAEVDKLFERYAYHTYRASVDLAKERGHYKLFPGSEYSKGRVLGRGSVWFEKNTKYGKQWSKLLADMKEFGTRFGYHTAPAPNTSTAGVVGTTAALLPIYKKYFVENNLLSPTVRVAPKLAPDNYFFYKEYIKMDMNDVIDMIATIYPWIDQSISFEWMIDPARTSPADLYRYYFRAWQKGIKTIYYVRSLSASVESVLEEDANTCESCSG